VVQNSNTDRKVSFFADIRRALFRIL
jgi:hypothetical protein